METSNLEEVSQSLSVWRYIPPIPCPICSAPTLTTWDSNYRDEHELLRLRYCPECDKVFTPESELKLIKGLTIVHEGKI